MTTNPRRRAVMARSIKLGHCVCDPKRPCPCDLLKQFNVCQCAGERLPVKPGAAALTQHVHKAGCASKIGQADLLRILGNLPPIVDANVLLGTAAGDDAGIYRLNDDTALVQTVDVFTPCVDDPYLFGQIAAANSVSDVYAMGGRPITALSIVGFPIEELDGGIMETILRGGIEKLNEAGCALIGGHSINDPEIKCGFAITGLIPTRNVIARDTARPGDALVLTKPLGTGMIAFAAQLGRADSAALAEAGASMATLNKDAAELMVEFEAHACTDVTGFGLAGHLMQMVRGSGVSVEIDLAYVPLLPGARMCLENDLLPGAIERNQEYVMAWVCVEDAAAEPMTPVLYDPQTSGGLLVSLPEDAARLYVEKLHERGHTSAAVIGRVLPKENNREEGRIIVRNSAPGHIVAPKENTRMVSNKASAPVKAAEPAACCDNPPTESCCDNPPSAPAPESGATPANALGMFSAFMKEANKPGLIDARNKKLMAIALSISQRCEPCIKVHMKSALAMGISLEEIDEAANLAISFGGCTAMMFYKEIRESFAR